MSMMQRLRIYHALLAFLVLAAYFSGEWGIVHNWLGYGVAPVILVRLLMAFMGAPQLGLMRFYPHFSDLKLDGFSRHPAISRTLLLGIAICLLGVTGTGISLDKGRSIGFSLSEVAPLAYADERPKAARGIPKGSKLIEEMHELFANFLIMLIAGHVTYLLIFKRPLARFMLFADAKEAVPKRPPAPAAPL